MLVAATLTALQPVKAIVLCCCSQFQRLCCCTFSQQNVAVCVMSRYIGLQQGDPDMTFDRLPMGEAMPEVEPGLKLLDLRMTSYQQLMDLSAASAPNPFGELLPFNPGVLPSRLGYMTGMLMCPLQSAEHSPDKQTCRGLCWLTHKFIGT